MTINLPCFKKSLTSSQFYSVSFNSVCDYGAETTRWHTLTKVLLLEHTKDFVYCKPGAEFPSTCLTCPSVNPEADTLTYI